MALVTSISSMFKRPEDRRDKLLSVLDRALNQFSDSLNRGNVKMKSTQDLERIVRSTCMVLSQFTAQSDTTTSSTTVESTVLNTEDPDVKSVYNKLFNTYNQQNDTD